MTAPFDSQLTENLVRAHITDWGDIQHILSPEYHGDPIKPENGVLSFYTFGWELIQVLREIGFVNVVVFDCWSKRFGYLGNNFVLLARKPN